MMKIISAANLKWADAAQTAIEMVVTFDTFGAVPFTASANDSEPHGVALFNDAVAGVYGPIAAYVAPVPTQDEIIGSLTAAVQKHLDDTARTRNYDGILSLCSYASSADTKFGPEGRAGVAWRDAVWASCYSILGDVRAGLRLAPTEADLLAALPAMVWPT